MNKADKPEQVIAELLYELACVYAHIQAASAYVMGPEVRKETNAAKKRIDNVLNKYTIMGE